MEILYPKKAKTQGHLRSLMNEDYAKTHNSLLTAAKYKVSHTTVLHWHHHLEATGNIDNKSSAPLKPHRTHEFDSLYLLYYLYKVEKQGVGDILEILEKRDCIFPRSTAYYHLKQW